MSKDELPLPDYDELPLGSVQTQIRALNQDALERLLGHERDHGDREPYLRILESRLRQLKAGEEPSGGDPAASSSRPSDTAKGSVVTPATAAQPSPAMRHSAAEQNRDKENP
ncbi:MAG: hypothetical protein ACRD0P_33275 [Stackebrandtia sp.]